MNLILRSENKLFFFFIATHLVVWTVLPTLMRFNLPMDAVEGTVWAQHLAWGYDKAPLLNAWITALVVQCFGHQAWSIYFVSQICVVTCFVAVWQLAKKILTPVLALISVFVLEAFQYYNIGAIDFNDNVAQLPFWALSSLFFYKCITEKTDNRANWIYLGFFAALAMLAKYYAVLLFASFFLVLCLPERRYLFKKSGLYLAVITFLMLMLPHIIWLFHNDFLTIQYVFRRVSDVPTWISHLINPLLFMRDESYALIVPVLMLSIFYIRRNRECSFSRCHSEERSSEESHEILRAAMNDNVVWGPRIKSLSLRRQECGALAIATKTFLDRRIILILSLIPIILNLCLSLLSGMKLHIMWGSPLFSLWGIMLILVFPPQLSSELLSKKTSQFLMTFCGIFFLLSAGYIFSIYWAKDGSSAHFPGKVMAQTLTKEWHAAYQKPLAYVVGPRWLAGTLSFYSNDHPLVWIDADAKLSPNISFDSIKQKGAIFIWDVKKNGEAIPPAYLTFVTGKPQIKNFLWHRAHEAKPIKIATLVIPPT